MDPFGNVVGKFALVAIMLFAFLSFIAAFFGFFRGIRRPAEVEIRAAIDNLKSRVDGVLLPKAGDQTALADVHQRITIIERVTEKTQAAFQEQLKFISQMMIGGFALFATVLAIIGTLFIGK